MVSEKSQYHKLLDGESVRVAFSKLKLSELSLEELVKFIVSLEQCRVHYSYLTYCCGIRKTPIKPSIESIVPVIEQHLRLYYAELYRRDTGWKST